MRLRQWTQIQTQLLGAAIVGTEAGELIHVVVALMQAGASARALVDAEIVNPTFAEGTRAVLPFEAFDLASDSTLARATSHYEFTTNATEGAVRA